MNQAERTLLQTVYSDRNVRERMLDYLGAGPGRDSTAVWLMGESDEAGSSFAPRPPQDLDSLLAVGCDLSRSLWDKRGLIAHLDIEYVNFDFPASPYLDPQRCFSLQEPVTRAILDILQGYRIKPLWLLTGRGFHFVWQVSRETRVFKRLEELGRQCFYQKPSTQAFGDLARDFDPLLDRAFAGLGLVVEFLGHQILEETAATCAIPVKLTDVIVGTGKQGREVVSIDLSEYADTLYGRRTRLPFSVYLKPEREQGRLGADAVSGLPLLFVIPHPGKDDPAPWRSMRETSRVLEMAAHSDVRIPRADVGTEKLIDAYLSSSLAGFHDFFYSREHDPPEKWHDTYDQTDLGTLPPCVRVLLEYPNDLLLKPAGIQLLVRTLLSYGWHPRHVAGLIRSRYEGEYGWGDLWSTTDPGNRADCYTRIFAGLFAVGRDTLVDLNCRSSQEKFQCQCHDCGFNLAAFRDSLIMRREYGRLACRPFNRLFLPN